MPPKGAGRPRRWCSDRCREAAKKGRRRAAIAWQPFAAPAASSLPADPVSRRRELVEDLLKMGAGERPRAPLDQAAIAVVEIRQLCWTLRRAAAQLEPSPAAARLHRAAADVEAAIGDLI